MQSDSGMKGVAGGPRWGGSNGGGVAGGRGALAKIHKV